MIPATNPSARQRQYELDRITYRYADAYRRAQAGHGNYPRITDYIWQYPQFALELAEYALWLAVSEPHEPYTEPETLEPLSPAAKGALARIRARYEKGERA